MGNQVIINEGDQNQLFISTNTSNITGNVCTNEVVVNQPLSNTIEVVSRGPQGVQGTLLPSNTGSFIISGSLTITGSFNVTGSTNFVGPVIANVTGSLLGTASFADYATSASYSISSSQAFSSSYAASGSYSSFASSASYAQSGSYASFASSASYAQSGSYASRATSASYALTASYAENIIVSGSIREVDYIDFDTVAPVTQPVAARLSWNNTDGTLDLGLKGGNVTLQVGQENVIRVVNKTGADLLEADFRVVRVRSVAEGGAQGQRLAVVLAQADNDTDSATTLGVVTENIPVNQEGFITIFGNVKNIDTTGAKSWAGSETWVDGDMLYLSPTHPGYLTNVKPIAPQHLVIIGYVEYAQQNNGKLFIKIDNGWEMGELHDVRDNTTSTSYGDLLVKSGSVWTNLRSLTGSYSITGSLTISGSSTFTNIGPAIFSGSISQNSNNTASLFFVTASVVKATSFTGSFSGSINDAVTASFANNIASGLNITASNIYVGGAITASSITAVSASFGYVQSVTGSAVIVGQEYIILNTQAPAARFAGLKIFDSGSNATASVVWDSQRNHLVYQNEAGASYSGGGFMSGPRNTGSLGDESYPTLNRIVRGQGGDHIYDSNITDNNTVVSFGIPVNVTGSVVANSFTGSLSAPGATTQIAYNNGGTLAADSGLVYSGSRVGIGIVNPTARLDINSTTSVSSSGQDTLRVGGSIAFATAGSGPKLTFYRQDNNVNLASIRGYTFGSLQTGLAFETGYDALTTRMVIDNTGSVGIGTTIPLASLHISGASSDNLLRLQSPASSNILFVSGSGNIGIGNASPTVALDVTGEIAIRGGENADDARMYFRASDQSNRFTIETDFDGNTNNDLLAFRAFITDNILVLRGNGSVGVNVANPSASLHVSGNILVGVQAAPALITSQTVTANTGVTTIYSLPTSSYEGAFFDYVVRSGSNARAGQVVGLRSGSSVNYTETTTTDFGSTAGFVFGMSISGSSMILSSSAASSGWTVKTIGRSI